MNEIGISRTVEVFIQTGVIILCLRLYYQYTKNSNDLSVVLHAINSIFQYIFDFLGSTHEWQLRFGVLRHQLFLGPLTTE